MLINTVMQETEGENLPKTTAATKTITKSFSNMMILLLSVSRWTNGANHDARSEKGPYLTKIRCYESSLSHMTNMATCYPEGSAAEAELMGDSRIT